MLTNAAEYIYVKFKICVVHVPIKFNQQQQQQQQKSGEHIFKYSIYTMTI